MADNATCSRGETWNRDVIQYSGHSVPPCRPPLVVQRRLGAKMQREGPWMRALAHAGRRNEVLGRSGRMKRHGWNTDEDGSLMEGGCCHPAYPCSIRGCSENRGNKDRYVGVRGGRDQGGWRPRMKGSTPGRVSLNHERHETHERGWQPPFLCSLR